MGEFDRDSCESGCCCGGVGDFVFEAVFIGVGDFDDDREIGAFVEAVTDDGDCETLLMDGGVGDFDRDRCGIAAIVGEGTAATVGALMY